MRTSPATLVAAVLLSGCAHHTQRLAGDDVARISGRATAGLSHQAATERDLVLAAKITVDHGFRYFRVIGANGAFAPQPGQDLSIKLYADSDEGGPDVFDAEAILIKGPRSGARQGP